jgi:hypothetical protein
MKSKGISSLVIILFFVFLNNEIKAQKDSVLFCPFCDEKIEYHIKKQDGQIQYIPIKRGKIHGLYFAFDTLGNLQEVAEFRRGKINGLLFGFENGQLYSLDIMRRNKYLHCVDVLEAYPPKKVIYINKPLDKK